MARRDDGEDDHGLLSALQKLDIVDLSCITSLNLIDAETLVLIVARTVERISGEEIQVKDL